MTTKIKSRLFKMLIPEIKRLINARYTHLEIVEKLNSEYSVDFKLSTFNRYLTRYRDLINNNNESDNQINDYQTPVKKENTPYTENNQNKENNTEKKIKTAIDNGEKSDNITSLDNKEQLTALDRVFVDSKQKSKDQMNTFVQDLFREVGSTLDIDKLSSNWPT